MSQENQLAKRSEKVGIVTSDKMTKTITVSVERPVVHQKYKKIIARTSKFKAHDEKSEAKVGDKVLIVETRPLSKTKRWALVKVIEKASAGLEL